MTYHPPTPVEQLRDAIESVAESAWGSWPSSAAQDRELFACVFRDGGDIVGATLIAPPTRDKLRELAEAAGCWWIWDEYGEPSPMPLEDAKAKFGGEPNDADPLETVAHIWLQGDTGIVTAKALAAFIRAQRGGCTCANERAGETECQRRPGSK